MPTLGDYHVEGGILLSEKSVYLYDNCQFMALLDFLHMSETSVWSVKFSADLVCLSVHLYVLETSICHVNFH